MAEERMSLLEMPRAAVVIIMAASVTFAVSVVVIILTAVLRRPASSCDSLGRNWARAVTWIGGVKVRREGGENLDPAASYVFASNHSSQYDIPVLQGHLGHSFRWLAKKELFRIPVWGRALRAAGYVPIDRSHGRAALKSLAEAAARVASGTSVMIFPEGTRSADGTLQDFKAGGFVLAIKAGVPIVPVALIGTYDILPKGRLPGRGGDVVLRIGSPVSVRDYVPRQKQDLADRIRGNIAALLEEGAEGCEKS